MRPYVLHHALVVGVLAAEDHAELAAPDLLLHNEVAVQLLPRLQRAEAARQAARRKRFSAHEPPLHDLQP